VKSWQRIAGVCLLVVAVVVIHQSVYKLRLFDGSQPGSGFMPFGLGVVLAALSVLLVVTNLGTDPVREPFWRPGTWQRPALALTIMGAFAAGFNWLGAVAAVVVLVVAWLIILERKRVVIAVITGVATGAVVHLLFEVALKAPFPRGVLFGG
jgi:hypothetical protein